MATDPHPHSTRSAAEAGALRYALQRLLEQLPPARSSDLDKARLLAQATLAIVNLGEKTAQQLAQQKEQLETHTQLIELLLAARNSLSAHNRKLIEILNISPEKLVVFQQADNKIRQAILSLLSHLRDRAAGFNAHKYADLLSLATDFEVAPQVYLRKYVDLSAHPRGLTRGWCFMRRPGFGETPQFITEQRFSTPEEALAWLQWHSEVLGLQQEKNLLDKPQPQM